jgi:predicted nucleotidyltransferase
MTAEKDRAKEIFDRFIKLHPNRSEVFNSTPANVQRWKWHIAHAESGFVQSAYTKQELPDNFDDLIEKRRVRTFADFSEKTQSIYRHIASFFPGEQVYACGSRVRGDYVELLDLPEVREWRRRTGKADKDVSDYDFYVRPESLQFGELPKHADRLRHGIPDEQKIPIPIMEGWDFSKLPKTEHGRVIELYNAGRWGELAAIHDQYGLSSYSYCCDTSGLKTWYKFGIESGKIKGE